MRPFGKRKHGRGAEQAPEAPVAADPVEPDIPELKKKDEERKRGGALWSGSGASGGASGMSAAGLEAASSSMGIATLEAGAARAGFLGSRAIAAALSKFFGGGGTWLGGLFAARYGNQIVLAGMALWAGLLSLAGLSLMAGSGGPKGSPTPALSMDGSGIVIDSPRDKALGMLAKANEGELTWEEHKTPAKPEEKKDAPQETAPAPEAPPMPDISALMGRQKTGLGDDFTQRLAKGMPSGVPPGMMGGAGAPAKPALKGGSFNLKSGLIPKAAARGKLATFAKNMLRPATSKMSSLRGRSNRAMGQLKMARTMSTAGAASAPDSQAHQYAANAFDQQASQGGQVSGIGGIDDTSPVVPPGTGTTGDPGEPPIDPPEPPPGTNVTPYQPSLDAAKGMGDMASMLKLLSIVLIALGIAIIAMAPPGPWQAFVIMIGIMVIAMGMMMLQMAGNMAGMAKNMGNMVENMYGQKDQGQIVDECADQAYSNGTKVANCQPATQPEENKRNTNVQQAVEEESNANYTIEGGGQGGSGSSNSNARPAGNSGTN